LIENEIHYAVIESVRKYQPNQETQALKPPTHIPIPPQTLRLLSKGSLISSRPHSDPIKIIKA